MKNTSEYNRAYYLKNKEKILARQREYRKEKQEQDKHELTPEELEAKKLLKAQRANAASKKYYAGHKDRMNAYANEYHKTKREARKEAQRKYYESHKAQIKEQQKRYRDGMKKETES